MTIPMFENAVAVVAAPNLQDRSGAEAGLKALGIRTVTQAGTLDATRSALAEAFVDVLIASAEWPDGDICDLLTEVRHGNAGPNPYLCVLVVATDREAPSGWRPLRFGADDLIIAPLSNEKIAGAVSELITSRKEFVATSDYIGPDRRADSGRETTIPLLTVPNSLRDKVEGKFDAEAIAKAIVDTMAEVDVQKLERHAAQLQLLANRVGPDLLVRGVDEAVDVFFEQMVWIAEDVERRLGSESEAAKACQALIGQVHRLEKMKGIPSTPEVGRLIQLAGVVSSRISNGGAEGAAAQV